MLKPFRCARSERINNITDNSIIIGDIRLSLVADTPRDAFEIDPLYQPAFIDEGRNNVRPTDEVMLRVHYGGPPDMARARKVFDTDSTWQLLESVDSFFVTLSSPDMEPPLYKILAIDKELSHGSIHINCDQTGITCKSAPAYRYPLNYPLDEMLMANVLSRGRGAELHGLGIAFRGRGLIFTGKSGAGKSTLGKLWMKRPGAAILSSDRLIVRRACRRTASSREASRSEYLVYGTPWRRGREHSYGRIPLGGIMILRQAEDNRVVELPPVEIAAALLVRSFPIFWDADGLQSTIDFLGRISTEVPCYELRFRPEQQAIDAALDAL